MFERWKIAALAELQLLFEITGEIVVARELDRRRKGCVSLHEHFARGFTAAGPSRDLRQQLESPFAGAAIRQVQGQIRIDDADQRDVWEMQALRDHLRPDQDVDLAGPEIQQ